MSNIRESVIKLGVNRGKPRIALDGIWLNRFGFAPDTKINVEFTSGKVVIRKDPDGKRKVSGRSKGRPGGIIDIESLELEQSFKTGSSLHVVAGQDEIVITPAKSLLKKAARVLTTVAVGLFVGGGLLDVAVHNSGFTTDAAVEVNSNFAEIWEANHGGGMHEMPIEEVDFAQMAKNIGGPVGLLVAGRPCEPFSNIRTLDRGGQTKRDKSIPPEAHELGHLDYYLLKAVDELNPHTVIIENVPGYLDAGSGYMVQGVLKSMGYNVEARVLNSIDYGSIQTRKRAVVIASTFDQITWPATIPRSMNFGQIMDDIHPDSDLWFGLDHWAPKHWAKQSAKGNGFAAPAVTAESTQVPTLKRRYWAGQGDNFVVAHPTRPNTWRWLTLTEGRKLMGISTSYNLGLTKTTAGELLGQGVVVPMFEALIKAITGGAHELRTNTAVAA